MTTSQGDLSSAPRVQISGKVFEDLNYGGGAGRSFASSGGTGRPTARVELYDAAGNFITSTVTDASGNYTWSYSGNKVTKSGTAAAPISSRKAGVRAGEGDSSISF